jgi:K+-sensing histidine kinase KdpD
MELTQENFATLKKRNSILEKQVKSYKEFSQIKRLNESQLISLVGSWSWDIKHDEVEWSDMMYKLLGLEPGEEIPSYQLALNHVHSDDKKVYENCLAKAMNNKEEYYLENRVVKKDKTIINVISRGICICNKENDLIRMVGTVQDVTLLKQLVDTNKQLEQFAHILSHDFKTPIRTIISFIGLIKRKSFENLTGEGKEYFSFIESAARQLSVLVNNILEYSKLSSPQIKITEIIVKEYIESILFDLNIIITEKKSEISLGWLPKSIYADEIKLGQVFRNLISNALKYTEPDIKPEIEIYCKEEKDHFIFHIKDNGIGIDNEYVDKIFEPYIRVKTEKSFSGTGIGLSICKRIIQMHSGEIGCSSNKSKGSCFYFSIPK